MQNIFNKKSNKIFHTLIKTNWKDLSHYKWKKSFSTAVIVEHNNTEPHSNTFAAINAALKFNEPISLIVVGDKCGCISDKLKYFSKVDSIIEVDHPFCKYVMPDVHSHAIMQIINKYNYERIIGGHSSYTRDILPYLASLLNLQPISDIVDIEGDILTRFMYTGRMVIKLRLLQNPQIISIRAASFPQVLEETHNSIPIHKFPISNLPRSKMIWKSESFPKGERPELGKAKVVISGGRAFKTKEHFDNLMNPLCEKLNAAIGASRAAVDMGFASNDLQVGQTGKVVAPDLYIAIGISGAIQHMAGIKDVKVIVAINKDPDAPIFQNAHYGLVGDLFTIVPEIIEKLAQQQNK